MSKKDRIAIVISALYFMFPLGVLFDGQRGAPVAFIVLTVPLIAYWGYRFIKNDITFLGKQNNG